MWYISGPRRGHLPGPVYETDPGEARMCVKISPNEKTGRPDKYLKEVNIRPFESDSYILKLKSANRRRGYV